MDRPLAIYTSYNIRYPLGGHVLAELHYIVGLKRLGYDVWVVEESGTAWAPCYDPTRNEMTRDPRTGIAQLVALLRPFGLDRSWCYVDSDRQYHGLTAAELRAGCRRSAVLFSRSGVNWLDEFAECPVKVFVDVDPGITQFKLPDHPVPSCSGFASPYAFDYCFTIGERFGQPDCPLPARGLRWRPTRHPVALELLEPRFTPAAPRFTTIMSWSSAKPYVHEGVAYGQKDVEFQKVIDLPRRVGPVLEVALSGNAPRAALAAAGWHITSARTATYTLAAYCDYLGASRGEFAVAKQAYVQSRCGWFSDRTGAYLAMGKPAIVQETGFSEFIPTGDGLLAFTTLAEAAAAIDRVNADYERQCRAARRIAEEHFDSDKVLGALLRQCNLPVSAPVLARSA